MLPHRLRPLSFHLFTCSPVPAHSTCPPFPSAQAFGSHECACGLKAVEYWLRAAEMSYDSSSLMEALKLFQQALDIAEVLNSMCQDADVMMMEEERALALGHPGSTALVQGCVDCARATGMNGSGLSSPQQLQEIRWSVEGGEGE